MHIVLCQNENKLSIRQRKSIQCIFSNTKNASLERDKHIERERYRNKDKDNVRNGHVEKGREGQCKRKNQSDRDTKLERKKRKCDKKRDSVRGTNL